MENILTWLQNTAYGEAARNYAWLFPSLETIHFLGLCILLGALLMLELRLVGIAPKIPAAPSLKFIPIAIFGFALCLISGIGFLCADPFNYWSNPGFRWKMVLIILAGINALLFEFLERRQVANLADGAESNTASKVIAGVSLIFWLSVIALGRLLPYTGGMGG